MVFFYDRIEREKEKKKRGLLGHVMPPPLTRVTMEKCCCEADSYNTKKNKAVIEACKRLHVSSKHDSLPYTPTRKLYVSTIF